MGGLEEEKLNHVNIFGKHAIDQWSPTLGLQMFLDFNSQKSWLAEVVVKASGTCSPKTSGGPRLGTTALHHTGSSFSLHSSNQHSAGDYIETPVNVTVFFLFAFKLYI